MTSRSLRDYQHLAIDFLLRTPRCGLWLPPGLGKTAATLFALWRLIYDTLEVTAGTVLIVGPKNVITDVWRQETALWDEIRGLRMSVAVGTVEERVAALKTPADIYLINRENLPWLVEAWGRRWPYRVVVWDESLDLKDHRSLRFRSIRKVSRLLDRVIELTGTPSCNKYQDLWGQLYLMDFGQRLGSGVTAFRDAYCVPNKRNAQRIFSWKLSGPKAEAEIKDKIKDLCMSLKREDWLKLPPKIDLMSELTLPPAAMATYKKLEKDAVLLLKNDDLIMARNAAVLVGKLVQAANGTVYSEAKAAIDIHDVKIEALRDIIDEANGEPVLVFYHFQHDLARLRKAFPQAQLAAGKGWVERWNRGEIEVLLAQPQAAGHGLNLQEGGNLMVWYSLPWSLELYLQGTARLDRQGQRYPVVVHHLIAKGTVDEQIIDALGDKHVALDSLLSAVRVRAGVGPA